MILCMNCKLVCSVLYGARYIHTEYIHTNIHALAASRKVGDEHNSTIAGPDQSHREDAWTHL